MDDTNATYNVNLTKFGLVHAARESHIPLNNLQVLNFKEGIKYVKTVCKPT